MDTDAPGVAGWAAAAAARLAGALAAGPEALASAAAAGGGEGDGGAWAPLSLSGADDGGGDAHEDASHGGSEIIIFQIFAALILGAGGRHLLKNTGMPYTVVLLLLGLVLGVASRSSGVIAENTSIGNIDPHLMLYTFLPVLLFESSYSLEYHVFVKSLKAILLLAVPGVLVASALTAALVYGMLPYGWGFSTCLLLGAILSATDPVAVVALLRELGASKTLATLIEGESLINDGTAIVVFSVVREVVVRERAGSDTDLSPGAVVLDFLKVALGGPLVGLVFGKLGVVWLSFVFNDALVEITVTLGFTYLTFFVAEGFLGVSGVLAVVVFGLYMNAVGRTRISTEVEHFLHRFYEMLAYLANTMIFILCGLVAAEKTDFVMKDFGYLLAIYVGIHLVRGFVVLGLSPLLTRTGYGLNFAEGVILTYGGLRGGVSLALAMLISIEFGDTLNGEDDATGSLILFHVAGIVCLTLLVNGTTIRLLLGVLGMNEISDAKMVMMKSTADHLRRETGNKLSALKRDPFLGDADWQIVRSYAYEPDEQHGGQAGKRRAAAAAAAAAASAAGDAKQAKDGTATMTKGNSRSGLGGTATLSKPAGERRGSALMPSVVGANGMIDMDLLRNDAVTRFLKALKQNYWHQFEGGQLGQNAVLALNHITETAMDDPRLNTHRDVAAYLDIPAKEQNRYDKYKDTPVLGKFLGKQMFGRVLFAFHVGLGFVHAHEYVLGLLRPANETGDTVGVGVGGMGGFRVVASNRVSKEIVASVKKTLEPVKRAIYMLREAHPEIAVAIKTVFASKRLLNYQKEVVKRVFKAGAIEEDEVQRYIDGIEAAMKRLHFSPPPIKLPDKAMYLKEAPCMRGVSPAAVSAIMEHAQEKSYRTGDYVIQTGEDSDGMYLILRGVVRIEAGGKVLAVEGPGTIFGELSLLTGGKRKASVAAETYCSALYVSTQIMQVLMRRYPHVRQRLWEYASMKIAETMLAGEEAFATWRRDALQLWIQTGTFCSYDAEQCRTNPRVDVSYVAVLLKGSVEYFGPKAGANGTMLEGRNVIYGPCTLRMAGAPKLIMFQDPQQSSAMLPGGADGEEELDEYYEEEEDHEAEDDVEMAPLPPHRRMDTARSLQLAANQAGLPGAVVVSLSRGSTSVPPPLQQPPTQQQQQPQPPHQKRASQVSLGAPSSDGGSSAVPSLGARGNSNRSLTVNVQERVRRWPTMDSARTTNHLQVRYGGGVGDEEDDDFKEDDGATLGIRRSATSQSQGSGGRLSPRPCNTDLDFTPSPRSLQSPSVQGDAAGDDDDGMDLPVMPDAGPSSGPSSPAPPPGARPASARSGRARRRHSDAPPGSVARPAISAPKARKVLPPLQPLSPHGPSSVASPRSPATLSLAPLAPAGIGSEEV